MAEFPALPLFTDAYLGDTTHLTTFEHGAYLLLLMASWRSRNCCVPDDDAMLARYTKTTRDKWRKLRLILAPFFSIREGHWHQARLQDEFQHLQSRNAQQIEAGNASARSKALKRANRTSTDVGSTFQRNGNETSTPFPHPQRKVPLDKESNGALVDSEKRFWDDGKTYLRRYIKGDPGALITKWLREYGKDLTIGALTAAQLERAVDPIAYITGYFRRHSGGISADYPAGHSGVPV